MIYVSVLQNLPTTNPLTVGLDRFSVPRFVNYQLIGLALSWCGYQRSSHPLEAPTESEHDKDIRLRYIHIYIYIIDHVDGYMDIPKFRKKISWFIIIFFHPH